MSKCLVTGGAGFIGSNLVDELIKRGDEVVIIDNLFTGQKNYINQQAKFYEMDICSDKVGELFKGEAFDYVFHLAAQIDVRLSVKDPVFDNRTNVLGGLNILKNCTKYKIKKIIFTSTGGAVYGDADVIPTPESSPAYPASPYGIHKLTFEKYLNYYKLEYGQNYTALRLANIYGPRQFRGGEAGVVTIFVDNAVNERKCIINGDGTKTRDYVYVSDVVAALIAAREKEYAGEINIGTGIETSILEIISTIEGALGKKIAKSHGPDKPGEQMRSCLDIGRAKEILNWEPNVALSKGIKATIEWSKNQKN